MGPCTPGHLGAPSPPSPRAWAASPARCRAGRGRGRLEAKRLLFLARGPPQGALGRPGEPFATPQQARPQTWSAELPNSAGPRGAAGPPTPGPRGGKARRRAPGRAARTPRRAQGPRPRSLPARGGRERRGHCTAGRCAAREGGWDLNASLRLAGTGLTSLPRGAISLREEGRRASARGAPGAPGAAERAGDAVGAGRRRGRPGAQDAGVAESARGGRWKRRGDGAGAAGLGGGGQGVGVSVGLLWLPACPPPPRGCGSGARSRPRAWRAAARGAHGAAAAGAKGGPFLSLVI